MKVAIAEPATEASINVLAESPPRSTECNQEGMTLHMPLPDSLTAAQKEKFLALLSYYADVLAINSDDLGCTTVLNYEINTGGAQPIRTS